MQPLDKDLMNNVFRDRNTSTNLNDKSIDYIDDQSPKLNQYGHNHRESVQDEEQELLIDGHEDSQIKVAESSTIRKVSLPSAGGLFSNNKLNSSGNGDVVKKRVRGDIRAVIA